LRGGGAMQEEAAGKHSDEALRASELRYRRLFEAAQDGILILDAKTGQINDVNPFLLRLLGYSYEEFAGKRLWEIGPFKDIKECKLAFQELQKKEYIRYEYLPLETKSGRSIAVEFVSNVYELSGGTRVIQCNIRDVSERRQAEEALHASELRYRRLFEAAQDGILILDAKTGQITDVNPFLLDLLGYSYDEFVEKLLWEIGLFKDIKECKLAFQELQEKEYIRYEYLPLETKDGRSIAVEFVSNVYGLGGGTRVIQCNIRDISERKRADDALRVSEETNRVTFEQAAVGIAHLAPDGRWLEVNQKFCDIVGYTREELLKMSYQDITHPDDLAADLDLVGKALAGEIETYSLEKRYVRKDQAVIWINLTASLVRTDSGEPRYFISIVQDITARLKVERESAELREKLAQSQKIEAIGQLAGGIAHDFNNLLMVIMAQTEMLSMGLEGKAAQRAKSVMDSALRAAELTGQLLAFSRKQPIQPRVTSMNQLMRGVSDLLKRLVSEDIDIHVTLQDKPWPVMADRSQMEQVIMNLVVNARDAMPDGGRLTIETSNVDIREEYVATHPLVPPGHYAMLAVTDTGTGMSAEVQARLFEPFFTTKEQGRGTGLGLSMVYGIVKQCGGFIWVYSELGKGTCFKIYLPKVESGESTAPEEHATQLPSIRRSATILVVEDEDNLRGVITEYLESVGHKVIVADSLDEASRVALENRQEIDLLLTDVILKGGNAKQLVHNLEEQGCVFRVLFMSGYTSDAIVRHGVLEPGIMFLQKPFSQATLLDKVEEALSSGS